MRKLRHTLALLCSALLGSVAAAPLDFVPAQPTYVLARQGAAQSALERDLSLLALPWLTDLLRDGYCGVLGCGAAALAGESPAQVMPAGMRKLFDELAKLARPEQWQMLGLKLDGELALYGRGALPVLRVELADADAFDGFVQALGEANGAPLRQVVLDDGIAWVLGSPAGEGQYTTPVTIPALLLARQDDAMVASFVAEAASDAQIQAQLARPAQALGRSGLATLAGRYRLDSALAGFVDLQRLTTQLFKPVDAADLAFRAAHGMDAPELQPLCASEALALAARVPGAAFGLAGSSDTQLSARWTLELEPALAGELSRASRSGTSLPDQGHAVDASLAVDLHRLLQTLGKRAGQGLAAPFMCEQFADANAAMQELQRWTVEVSESPWGGLLGARVEFPGEHGYSFDGVAGMLEMRDPLSLLRTLASLFPSLAELQLSADGKHFVLQEGEGDDRLLASVSGTRIHVAAGGQAEQRLQQISAVDVLADAPMLSVRIGRMLIDGSGWFSSRELAAMGDLAQRTRSVLLEGRLTTRGVEGLLQLELDAR